MAVSGRRFEAVGEGVAEALQAGVEGDVGERGLARQARRVGGEPVERDPRGAAAVLVPVGNRDRFGEPVHAQREDPERVALAST